LLWGSEAAEGLVAKLFDEGMVPQDVDLVLALEERRRTNQIGTIGNGASKIMPSAMAGYRLSFTKSARKDEFFVEFGGAFFEITPQACNSAFVTPAHFDSCTAGCTASRTHADNNSKTHLGINDYAIAELAMLACERARAGEFQ